MIDENKKHLRELKKYKKQREQNQSNGCKYVIGTLESRALRLKKLKYCPRCKKTKSFKDFNKSKETLSCHCTLCSRELAHKYDNPEKRKEKYQLKKEQVLNYNLKRKFGITLEEYNVKLKKQGDKCMICKISTKENGKRLAVDHNHTSGSVRDLLCANCNAAIGFLQENVQIAKNALKYITRWSK